MLHRVNLDLGAYQTLHTGHVTSCSIDSESTLPRHRSIPERNVCRSGIHSWKAWHQSIWPTCVRATEEVVVVCSMLLLWGSGPATLRRWHPSGLSTDARRAMWLSQPFNGSTFACMCEWLCVSALADRGDLSSVRSSRAG